MVETLFTGIKNVTAATAISKFQQPEDVFFGAGLTRLKITGLVRCMGHTSAGKVDPAVGT